MDLEDWDCFERQNLHIYIWKTQDWFKYIFAVILEQ